MNQSQADDLIREMALKTEEERLDRERRLSCELLRPFRLLPTRISLDGTQWCVLYGENVQDGVAGFGDSPELASRAFDVAWQARQKETP